MQGFIDWVATPETAVALTAVSLLLVLVSALAIPPWIARLPDDYFVAPARRVALTSEGHPLVRALVYALRNLIGLVLLFAGIVMLVAPGQGLLTIFAASFFLDFPGKRRLQRRVLSWPPVLRTINRLRRRAGRRPLAVRVDPASNDEGAGPPSG